MRRRMFAWIVLGVAGSASCGCVNGERGEAPSQPAWPLVASGRQDPRVEARIAALLPRMTLAQKVAQMVQADIRSVTPEDVRLYRLGAILNGGGVFPEERKHASIRDWVALADRFHEASIDEAGGAPAIPLIWGTDAVHGHNNVVGATLFPHNIGLGATRDPDLIERIGAATAREVAATGIDWTFAPVVAVARDDRWGRTYESYSEDPQLVREYAQRMIRGLQGNAQSAAFLDHAHVIATAKHFIGDGGTAHGIDRGDNPSAEQELLTIHAQGFLAALNAGVQTVMASYSSWRGQKVHGSRYLLTDVLKRRLGFDGVVVSDWDGIEELPGCSKDKCAAAIDAGIDMVMVPAHWRSFIANTLAQVEAGQISAARIDDAVTRILRVKFRAGVFDKGRPSSRPLAGRHELIGSPEHRQLAREAVRKSLVLLKNEGGLLPLRRNLQVLVAGAGADDISRQSGGWSVTWQGTGNSNADFPGATSIFAGIRTVVEASGGKATLDVEGRWQARPDVAIVVFGEGPYAERAGDLASIDYQESAGTELRLLRRLREASVASVCIFLTGRPLWITPELEACDAFVVAWLPGSEGGGVADVIFRNAVGAASYDFVGRLAFSWPRDPLQTVLNRNDERYEPLFPYGFGLSY